MEISTLVRKVVLPNCECNKNDTSATFSFFDMLKAGYNKLYKPKFYLIKYSEVL